MKKIVYGRGVTSGAVDLPPSKSIAHRALICAALSDGECEISPIDNSADMCATFNFIKAIGKTLLYNEETKTVIIGTGEIPKKTHVNSLESGSTLRFIIPIVAAMGIECTFTGLGRLPKRPIGIYSEILRGIVSEGEGLPYKISGKLESGEFILPGDISSQFITGLLLALPLLEHDSKIILSTNLESASYVNLTLQVMREFGIVIDCTDYGYFVHGSGKYKARNYKVEGDWSQAAFFLSMAAFTKGKIQLHGLNFSSEQGDKACVEIFRRIGVQIENHNGILVANNPNFGKSFNGLRAVEIDASDIPDMVPAISITAALSEGKTIITKASRLRIKESDRLKAIYNAITAVGGKACETEDGLIITGVKNFTGGEVLGCNDHRIVMSVAAAAACSSSEIVVTDPWSIKKSYPDFFKDYVNLGGKANVIDIG